jgi:hypothetical protein
MTAFMVVNKKGLRGKLKDSDKKTLFTTINKFNKLYQCGWTEKLGFPIFFESNDLYNIHTLVCSRFGCLAGCVGRVLTKVFYFFRENNPAAFITNYLHILQI